MLDDMFASTDDDFDRRRGPANSLLALVFRLEDEWLALPVEALEEVGAMRAVHRLPHRRNGVLLGVVNVRGTLLACLSLKAILNIESAGTKTEGRARLLVLNTRGAHVAVLTDEVDGVRPLDLDMLTDVPATLGLASVRHTRGCVRSGERQVGLLDMDAVLTSIERGMQ